MRYAVIEKQYNEIAQVLLFATPQEAVREAAFIANNLGYIDAADDGEECHPRLAADWWEDGAPDDGGVCAWDTEKQRYLLQGDEE